MRVQVKTGVLPQWARGAFSDPKPRIPVRSATSRHSLGGSHFSHRPAFAQQQILWVSRVTIQPGSDLRIAAQRMQGTHPLGAPVHER